MLEEKRYPDEQACLALLHAFGTPDHVIAHCKAVAAKADQIGAALVAGGYSLDLGLIHAGALLHDIARTEPNHEFAGAQYVEKAGCHPKVAEIVGMHMDLPESETHEITEKVVVYLADKLVEEDKEVSLKERYAPRIARADGAMREMIEQKYKTAQRIDQMVSDALSKS